MRSKNREEKRRRRERTAAWKGQERMMYREKYKERNCADESWAGITAGWNLV